MPRVDRITFDPQVMGGKPCIRHMRVTVGTIVGLFATGRHPRSHALRLTGTRYHAAYSAGRNSNVSTVAISNPPIIA
ncbi:MAG: DUF433 domain-containing protein [Gammaproteobacteria bacterium]